MDENVIEAMGESVAKISELRIAMLDSAAVGEAQRRIAEATYNRLPHDAMRAERNILLVEIGLLRYYAQQALALTDHATSLLGEIGALRRCLEESGYENTDSP